MSEDIPTKSSPERISLFGLPLDIGIDAEHVLARFAEGGALLTYLNPLAYAIARNQPEYANQLKRFDLVVCDGVGIQKAVQHCFGIRTEILTPDLFGIGDDYLKFASNHGLDLVLVGGAPGVAERASEVITRDYPGIRNVRGFDGYGDSPHQATMHILQVNPGMVLVGMGMGHQEAPLLDLRDKGWTGIGIGVGGFFDKLADPTLDYPEWSKRIGMRFAGRLVRQPRRMVKRYFWDYRIFEWRYILSVLGIRYRAE